jgi:hypothetical protein
MDASNPQTFRLDPQRHAVVARRRLLWLAPYMLVMLAGMMWLMWYLQRGLPQPMSGQTAITYYVVIAAVLGFSMFRVTRRAARTYQLTLSEDWLRIEVDQMLPVEVRRADVRAVRETAAGLVIHRIKGLPIGITRAIDGYLQIRDHVITWAPATARPRSEVWTAAGGIAVVLGWLGLGGLSLWATAPASSVLLAIGAAGCALWLRWFFGQIPHKRRKEIQGFMLLQALAIVLLNVLRWIALPH